MRHVGPGDLWAAARALHPVPGEDRARVMAALLARAEAADKYRRRYRRAHSRWGDGSLVAAALADRPPPAPGLGDPSFAAALASALDGLIAWRAEKAVRGGWSPRSAPDSSGEAEKRRAVRGS